MTAHVFKTIVIHCNRPGCLVKTTHVAERMTDGRKAAQAEGWRLVNLPVPTGGPAVTADLCPDHVDYPIALEEVRSAPPARKAG